MEYALKLDFPIQKIMKLEYEELIAGIGLPKALRVKNIKIYARIQD